MRLLLSAAFVIALTVCGKDSTGPAEYALPVVPSASAVCATLTPLSRTVTDQSSLPAWLDVFARLVPGGYAGYDVRNGKATLLLVDTTLCAAARDNIGALRLCSDFPPNLGFALPTAAVAAVRYDFTRLNAWDHLLADGLASTKGVTNRQFDIPHNQIVVTVSEDAAASAVRSVARKAGVPDAALVTKLVTR